MGAVRERIYHGFLGGFLCWLLGRLSLAGFLDFDAFLAAMISLSVIGLG